MTQCSNCKGEGLVGVGETPWLRQGDISTCSVCNGSGSVADEATEVALAEVVPEAPVEEAPVDNSNLTEGSSPDLSVGGSEQASEVNQEEAPVEPVPEPSA